MKKGGGGALVHVYVLEHIVSLNYRIAWWIFTKLGRDKVLMIPHICIDSWAKSAQGWIQGGAKIDLGGSLLQRTSSDRKATATYWMHISDLEAFEKKYCYFWFHWEVRRVARRTHGSTCFHIISAENIFPFTLPMSLSVSHILSLKMQNFLGSLRSPTSLC